MPLNIRLMTASDVDAVHAIETKSHVMPWSKQIFSDCVFVGYDCYVMEDTDNETNTLVAYLIARISENQSHLLNICVHKAHQNQTFGTQLLTFYLQALEKRASIESIYLEVRPSNKVALHLYESFGFTQIETKKDYYRDTNHSEDAIVLMKNINCG